MIELQDCKYSQAIVRKNVDTIEQANVFVLLGNHGSRSNNYIFNENIIKKFYNHGDIILVEDSRKKKKVELIRSQIPNLPIDGYDIAGWDLPELQHNPIMQLIRQVENAIYVIENKHGTTESLKRKRAYEIVEEFIKTFSDQPLPGRNEEQALLDQGKKALQIGKNCAVLSVSQIRQSSLIDQIVHWLKIRNRKIFILAGTLHGDTTDPRFAPQADQLVNELKKHRFIILNQRKIA